MAKKSVDKSVCEDLTSGLSATIGVVAGMVAGNTLAEAMPLNEDTLQGALLSTEETPFLFVSADGLESDSQSSSLQNDSESDDAIILTQVDDVSVVDTDLDGYADSVCVDDNEPLDVQYLDVSDEDTSMDPLQQAVSMQDAYVEDNPDYVNDANVDEFMV